VAVVLGEERRELNEHARALQPLRCNAEKCDGFIIPADKAELVGCALNGGAIEGSKAEGMQRRVEGVLIPIGAFETGCALNPNPRLPVVERDGLGVEGVSTEEVSERGEQERALCEKARATLWGGVGKIGQVFHEAKGAEWTKPVLYDEGTVECSLGVAPIHTPGTAV
jgi:hypothetical protein